MPCQRSASLGRGFGRTSVLAAIALLLGCTDLGSNRSASGAWIGVDGDRTVRLFLTEDAGEITGWGSIEDPDGDIYIDQGTHTGEQFYLSVSVLYSGGYSFGSIEGTIHQPRIIATLSGLAFESDRITLTRWR
jgi:hypothetical protein